MEEAVKEWNERIAYGRANYLKETEIKIKRSLGEIDDGLIELNPPSEAQAKQAQAKQAQAKQIIKTCACYAV